MRKIKSASKDFTENDLPSTRVEVFWDVFKLRFKTLLQLGFWLFIFLSPLILALIVRDGIFLSVQGNNPTDDYYFAVELLMNCVEVLLFPIAGIGFAGAFRVIRNLAWGEPVFFKEDFFDGMGKNGKQFVLLFLLLGIVNLVNTFMSSVGDEASIWQYIPLSISVVYFLPIGLFSLSLINVYNNTMIQNFKLGSQMYMRYFWKNILAILATVVWVAILYIPQAFIKYIVIFAVIIFILPCVLLGWFLYSCYLFDDAINKTQNPEIYDKGIHRKGLANKLQEKGENE